MQKTNLSDNIINKYEQKITELCNQKETIFIENNQITNKNHILNSILNNKIALKYGYKYPIISKVYLKIRQIVPTSSLFLGIVSFFVFPQADLLHFILLLIGFGSIMYMSISSKLKHGIHHILKHLENYYQIYGDKQVTALSIYQEIVKNSELIDSNADIINNINSEILKVEMDIYDLKNNINNVNNNNDSYTTIIEIEPKRKKKNLFNY